MSDYLRTRLLPAHLAIQSLSARRCDESRFGARAMAQARLIGFYLTTSDVVVLVLIVTF